MNANPVSVVIYLLSGFRVAPQFVVGQIDRQKEAFVLFSCIFGKFVNKYIWSLKALGRSS